MARWEQYSAGLPSASLELRVAQRALRDGCSAKEVTLMLVAGSKVVRQIHDVQGKKDAIAFARHITTLASQQQGSMTKQPNRLIRRSLEMGD